MNIEQLGNLCLIGIGLMCVALVLHGDTVVKVPRYAPAEIDGREMASDEMRRFRALESESFGEAAGKAAADWNPPCLPEDSPDFGKLAAADTGDGDGRQRLEAMADLLRRIEESHKRDDEKNKH